VAEHLGAQLGARYVHDVGALVGGLLGNADVQAVFACVVGADDDAGSGFGVGRFLEVAGELEDRVVRVSVLQRVA
jgi:hypothetical protein